LKLTTDRYEASRGLFATAELLVSADVQRDAASPSSMHVTALSIDQQLRRRHFVIMLANALLHIAGVAPLPSQLFNSK